MHAIYNTFCHQGGIRSKGDECMQGSPGKPGERKRRMHDIYSTLDPQGGIGWQGSDECMLFTTRWVLREVSEATNACYL